MAALAVPVLLHLWRRPATVRQPWAAMRLLEAALAEQRRRLTWRHRSLLLIRLGFVLLLLLAVILPQPWVTDWVRLWWPQANWTQGSGELRGTHYVLVFDATLSMTHRRAGTSSWQRAVREARERLVLAALPQDGFSVVFLEAEPRSVWTTPCGVPSEVLEVLDTAQPSHRGGDTVQALHLARQRLDRGAGLYARQEVHVYTDMQAATWQGRTDQEREALQAAWRQLHRGAWVKVIDVGTDWPVNYSVTALQPEKWLAVPGEAFPLRATVRGLGQISNEVLPVSLWVGRVEPGRLTTDDLRTGRFLHLAERREIRLPPGRKEISIPWTCRFPQAGLHVVQMRLETEDSLLADNSTTVLVQVRESPRIVLIDGSQAAASWENETSFLRIAWDNPRLQTQWTVCSLAEIRQPGFALLAQLEQADVWVFGNVPALEPGWLPSLERHLQRGGSVLFFLGDQVQSEAYAAAVTASSPSLFPVELLSRETPSSARAGPVWRLQTAAEPQMPFARAVQPVMEAGLAEVRFQRFWKARLRAGAQAQVLLRWQLQEEGDKAASPPLVGTARSWPAVITARHGAGRVMIVTHGTALREDRFPLQAAFLPLMQELLLFLLAGETAQPPRLVGEPLEWPLPGDSAVRGTLLSSSGQEETMEVVAAGTLLRSHNTRESGLYRLLVPPTRDFAGATTLFAVQPQVQEEDGEAQPRRLSEEEFRALHPETEFSYQTRERRRLLSRPALGLHPSWWCLLGAACLLALELRLTRERR